MNDTPHLYDTVLTLRFLKRGEEWVHTYSYSDRLARLVLYYSDHLERLVMEVRHTWRERDGDLCVITLSCRGTVLTVDWCLDQPHQLINRARHTKCWNVVKTIHNAMLTNGRSRCLPVDITGGS